MGALQRERWEIIEKVIIKMTFEFIIFTKLTHDYI